MAVDPRWLQQLLSQTQGINGPLTGQPSMPDLAMPTLPATGPTFGQSQIPSGLGRIAGALFPAAGGANLDPEVKRGLQSQALLNFGLGLMAAGNRPGASFGGALGQAFLGAQGGFQDAVQNAYQNARQAKRDEREDQLFAREERALDRQQKVQERQDRQQASVTAGRLATGLQASGADMPRYWQMVAGMPDVQAAVSELGLQVPSQLDPESWRGFQQQLANASALGSPLMAPRDLQLKAVVDPRTGKPVYLSEQQALGMQPYEQGPGAAFSPIQLADGTYGVLNQRTGQISRTGEQAAPKAGNAPSEGERTASNYFGRMSAAEQRLGNYVPSNMDYLAAQNIIGGGSARSIIANNLMTPEGQAYYQSASDWVRAKLRKESGAVISPQEEAAEIRTYFPVPGDTPETVEQKRIARLQAQEGMREMGGRAVTEKAAPPPEEPEIKEGATAVGPNGERIILRNGQWVPLNG